MKKLVILILALLLLCSCSGCEKEEQAGFTIASWNVQNIFDSVNDGTEYSEYKHQNGWNDNAYRARLKAASTVLKDGDLGRAGIIVLNEVENQNVVLDLMAQLGQSYLWHAVASEDGGAISLAVISSIPMKEVRVHRIEGARPIIEARFEIDSKSVFVFAVHAKSNLGETEENTALRALLGQALSELTSLTKADYPDCLIIIAGDFNEEPWDGNVISDFKSWRCFWEDVPRGSLGSYYYDGRWLCYDNILLSSDMIDRWGVEMDGITTNEEGLPNRWDRNTLSGVSDHLPIWVSVV